MNAERLKSLLNLVPLTVEGGYFVETYRSAESISHECLADRYSGPRTFGTCIYFLLEPETFSEIHRLASDEIFHFTLATRLRCSSSGPMVRPSGWLLVRRLKAAWLRSSSCLGEFGKEQGWYQEEGSRYWAVR